MKRKKSHVGCLFWIALILLAVVIFVFNRSRFEGALTAIGLTNLVTLNAGHKPAPAGPSGGEPSAQKPAPALPGPTPAPQPASGAPGTSATAPAGSAPPAQPAGSAPLASRALRSTGASGESAGGGASTDTSSSRAAGGTVSTSGARGAASSGIAERPQPSERSRQFDLYFVRVAAGGTPTLAQVNRQIAYGDSPLTDTIRTLLDNQAPHDAAGALISLIPAGTKLLDATVRDGTAYLDFNDRLRFNAFGADGYRVALQQLVFTATQFPTVQRVQLLIDGKVHQYLGPEGVPIDKPLDRGSFTSVVSQSGE